MCNIEITFDFQYCASCNIYINNSDVFTRLRDYYSTTHSRFVYDFSLVLYLHTRLDVRRRTAAVNFRNCSYTNCQMAANVQSIRQPTYTNGTLYTRVHILFTRIKKFSYRITSITICENDCNAINSTGNEFSLIRIRNMYNTQSDFEISLLNLFFKFYM